MTKPKPKPKAKPKDEQPTPSQRRRTLSSLRAKLLSTLANERTKPGAVPGLSRELRAVESELEELDRREAQQGDWVDELKAKREAREAAAGHSRGAARRGQPRKRGGRSRSG